LVLSGYSLARIRYFTARVKSTPVGDPGAPQRQAEYFRALATLPSVTIHEAKFYLHAKWKYLAQRNPTVHRFQSPLQKERVMIAEEKGSDVNLATHLVADGFRGDYDTAVVFSNDSDLAEPIRIVCSELQKPIILINPHMTTAWDLRNIPGVNYRSVRLGALQAAQFPPQLQDANGPITKPSTW